MPINQIEKGSFNKTPSVNKKIRAILNPTQSEQVTFSPVTTDTSINSPRRKEQLLMAQQTAEKFDYQLFESLGLKVNTNKLDQISLNQADELRELIIETPQEVVVEALQQAVQQSKNPENKFSFPKLESKIARLASLFLIFILAGVLVLIPEAANATSPLPEVTPTVKPTKDDVKVLLPTPTLTPTPAATAKPTLLETVTPTPEAPKKVTTSVTTDNVNARTGPGTSFGVEIVIPEGTEVVLLDEPKNDWVKISFVLDGKEYGKTEELYVSLSFLTEPITTIITPNKPTVAENNTEEIDTEAIGGTTSPVLFDTSGFPTSESIDGAHRAVNILTSTEFAQLVEINGQELINELPKQVAYGLPDGRIVVKQINQTDISAAKFAVTQTGIYASLNLDVNKQLVMKWEGDIEYRADWKIPQFEGEHVTISISSAFNDIHPRREVIIEGKKQYLLAIHNGTTEEALASAIRKELYANAPESVAWYQEYHFIEKDPQPISITPEYESSVKLDKLIQAFWQMLDEHIKDGKVYLPKLQKEININQKVEITAWRFPDEDEGKIGWRDGYVGPYPQHLYQVNEKTGALVIHITPARTGSHNLSSIITGAFEEIIYEEFGLEPDWMDMESPGYTKINSSVVDLVAVDANTTVIVLPTYVDAAEESSMTLEKID